MQATFHLNYNTHWGQSISLLMYHTDIDYTEYKMNCENGLEWLVEIPLEPDMKTIHYKYAVNQEWGGLHTEYGKIRKQDIPATKQHIDFYDNWRTPNGDAPFETIAFSECFFKRKESEKPKRKLLRKGSLHLQIYAPQVEPNRHIAVVGNQDILGNWDVSKKVRLDDASYPIWSTSLDSKEVQFPLEYKYLLVDTETDEVVAWEAGTNRRINQTDKTNLTVVNDENFVRPIPSWKTSGVAIPVFSLRSEESFGTGDFMDLKKMVDWAEATGQHFIQILPINDTILHHSNVDSYPYNAVSVYALHPIYLRLEEMGTPQQEEDVAYFEERKKELNAKSFSDYQNVLNEKWKYFKLIYKSDSDKTFQSAAYKHFFENNKEWLVPYAAFSFLRDKYGTPEFKEWKQFQVYNKKRIETFSAPNSKWYNEIAFFYFLQYHLHTQLIEVREYAHSKGIALKSDVPIGVSAQSVDVWVEPELFNTNMQAGAPPDDFSMAGQNWGFPTYNWEAMEKDSYLWWKKRFQKFMEYFDAYRIDHILGFFRIWEIPKDDVWALTGSFNPSLPFSIQELRDRGLWWNEDRFLKPYLKEHVIRALLGENADTVMHDFLEVNGWQSFQFKADFDTQKKIERHFASFGSTLSDTQLQMRDGLYKLHSEVLFVRDSNQPDKFNPRISMHASHTFRDLDDYTRHTLDRIYLEYFYSRHSAFWKDQAMKKLPAIISANNMLVCGEDLGMVPDSVEDVMRQLELLTLEIQRMPKKEDIEFAMPDHAPYLSVCTTSTHDMNPVRAWWQENRDVTQRFFNYALGYGGAAPEVCSPDIVERVVAQHLYSGAMLVILPWQDWMGMDEKLRRENPHEERINVPSNPKHFWCYRMHLTLEQLLAEEQFNNKLKKMITDSGR